MLASLRGHRSNHTGAPQARMMKPSSQCMQQTTCRAVGGLQCDVAIVGGGLGGLAMAAGMRHRGFDAHVFEAAPALRTATGTLISLGINALNSLDAIHPEIVPRIKKTGVLRQYVNLYVRTARDAAPSHTRTAVPPNTWGFRWSEVQRVLSEVVPAEAVHCRHRGTGFTEQPGHVILHFKDQPDVTARMCVAADGVRSQLRATQLPSDPGPRFIGQMNWSAISHNPGLVDVCDLGESLGYCNHPDFNEATLQLAILRRRYQCVHRVKWPPGQVSC